MSIAPASEIRMAAMLVSLLIGNYKILGVVVFSVYIDLYENSLVGLKVING